MSYTYIIPNDKYYSYLTGGTSIDDLDTTISSIPTSGTTNDVDYAGFTGGSFVVTGECTSRLSELRKYTITDEFINQYFGNGSYNSDGVDYVNSISGVSVVYYIGGIRYVDTILTGTTIKTTFDFISTGILSPNFIDIPIYKDPKKENIISNPKIGDDVFIVRQALSVFENNYRLEQINNLNELMTYAGGKFFNVTKNS